METQAVLTGGEALAVNHRIPPPGGRETTGAGDPEQR